MDSSTAPRQLTLEPQRDIYSVARLNREARGVLEGGFPALWVEGELSNLSRPASGHIYFSLKDARAQVRCAMFRERRRQLAFDPAPGMQVLVRAQVTLYEGRGDFQLRIEHMEQAGEGALRRAYDELKRRLAAEGLFAAEHKQPLPAVPRRIGVITSASGAALHDVLQVLGRRFPLAAVLVYPVSVQGTAAAPEIVAALRLAQRRAECDVLLLTRGGGSLEDLWSFNEEAVARAIHASTIPLICGVGHEIDITIADYVADARAPTPSAAAELLVPDREEWLRLLAERGRKLVAAVRRRQRDWRDRMGSLDARLARQHPGERLRQRAQRLDELEHRLVLTVRQSMAARRGRLKTLHADLRRVAPARRIAGFIHASHTLRARLDTAVRGRLGSLSNRVSAATRTLDTVGPQATLERGYAIVTLHRADRAEILRSAADAAPGAHIEARLAHGRITAIVDKSEKENK